MSRVGHPASELGSRPRIQGRVFVLVWACPVPLGHVNMGGVLRLGILVCIAPPIPLLLVVVACAHVHLFVHVLPLTQLSHPSLPQLLGKGGGGVSPASAASDPGHSRCPVPFPSSSHPCNHCSRLNLILMMWIFIGLFRGYVRLTVLLSLPPADNKVHAGVDFLLEDKCSAKESLQLPLSALCKTAMKAVFKKISYN